jgi:hypothetical protein
MTQQRWWLASALLTLALTCSTRAQEVPSSEPLPMPHPCSDPAEPDCTGSCGGSCAKTGSCPASARHNEGSGCCQAKGCCAGCSACCAAEHKKAKKACHGEDCAPSAAMILPTWFGPMPVPLPPPMAALFYGAGMDYHVHVSEPPAPTAVPVPPPPVCSMPAMAPACPYAFPPPPPPLIGFHHRMPGCPAGGPPVMSYTIIQREQAVSQSWHLHVCGDCDKAEMEMEGCATKLCCDSMDVTIGDKHALKVSIHHKQIAIEGDNLKAYADKISKGGDGDSIVLDGHVHIEYEQDDQKVDATVGHVKISLKDGHMDIKMGSHETVPASCH